MQTVLESRSTLPLDEDGLLIDPTLWNESVAQDIAKQLGIAELNEGHWKVIHALREHYEKFGVAPAMSHICRRQGKEWQWAHELFHTCLNAWRIAGLPNPGEEAKSYLSDM